jgi:hypothetical protein
MKTLNSGISLFGNGRSIEMLPRVSDDDIEEQGAGVSNLEARMPTPAALGPANYFVKIP